MSGQADELAWTRSLLRLALSPAPIELLLREALEAVLPLTGASRALLQLSTGAGSAGDVWRVSHALDDDESGDVLGLCSEGIVARALQDGETVVTTHARTDPRFRTLQSVRLHNLQGVVCAPLGHPARGVLYLQGDTLSTSTLERLELFRQHLATILLRRAVELAPPGEDDPTAPWRARLGGATRIVGQSPALADALRRLALVADRPVDVLLTGPSGAGKTAFAELLGGGPGWERSVFVEVSCANLQSSLFEAELFGVVAGAATGVQKREGLVAAAAGGTLFFDEVGELPHDQQARLLTFLESRRYRPVGANVPRRAKVRVVAATNRDLEEEVAAGRFREDLFHRLAGWRVDVPGLARRRDDIPVLVRHFARAACEELELPHVEPSPAAVAAALRAEWRGNVRQLRTAVFHAVLEADALGLRSFGPALLGLEGQSLGGEATFAGATKEFQRGFLRDALQHHGWNVSETARALSMNRTHLHELLRSLDISRP